MAQKRILNACLIIGMLFCPAVASAHAFAEPFVVPVPLSLYLIGSTIALVASFCFFYFFSTSRTSKDGAQRIEFRPAWLPGATTVLKCLGAFFFLLTLATGIFGGSDFTTNPAPALFWFALILVVTYLSALIDGIWAIANPFENITRAFIRAFARDMRPVFRYPEYLGCTPALAFYYGLVWLELFSNGAGGLPVVIVWLLCSYLVLSLTGSFLFGVSDWFRYGDFFNIFFGTIGTFAPIRITEERIEFTKPFARLFEERADGVARMLFVLFILAATAFDGFTGTQTWSNIVYATSLTTALATPLTYVLFALALPSFFGFYALVIWIMKKSVHTGRSFSYLLLRFSYALIPIAVAYNIAHYLTWVVTQGINLLALFSDPFHLGWNLLGTKAWAVSTVPLSPDTVWNIQVAVIVIAHIIATYVAHKIALEEFGDKRTALKSQLPMLILMIGYTMLGLWILSQPVGGLS